MKVSERLEQIRLDNPELNFQNEGYEYLSKEVRDYNSEAIEEIESLLRELIGDDFREFNNFRRGDKSSNIYVRIQQAYDSSFTGVVYLDYDDIDELELNKEL